MSPAASVVGVPLEVTVVAPDGKTPVVGASVRAYTGAGPVDTSDPTNTSGITSLMVPPGDYCLSARTAPEEWDLLEVVAPPTVGGVTLPKDLYGPVVKNGRSYVPFSDGTFRTCYDSLPVRVGRNGGKETIQMVAPLEVNLSVLGLSNEEIGGVNVYAVIPLDSVRWIPMNTGSEYRLGFLSGFVQTSADGKVKVPVSKNVPFYLEFQQGSGDFFMTGTFAGDPTTSNLDVVLEASPLMCEQTMGTGVLSGAPGLDFTKVNFGYSAAPNPTVSTAVPALVLNDSQVAVELVHKGTGPVTVTFRTDLPMGRHTTTVDYFCAGDECSPDPTVKLTGTGNAQEVEVFHVTKAPGVVKTVLVLQNIASEHTQVLFAAKTPGDAVPVASRNNATDAFYNIPQPTACVVERSNDDKWAVGDI